MESSALYVLLVEDELTDQMVVERAAAKLGSNVHLTKSENGLEALNYLYRRGAYVSRSSSIDPHIVIVDSSLPDMKALYILKAIRDNPSTHRLPVIILGTPHTDNDRDSLQIFQGVVFLIKSIDPDAFESQLVEAISHSIRSQPGHRATL